MPHADLRTVPLSETDLQAIFMAGRLCARIPEIVGTDWDADEKRSLGPWVVRIGNAGYPERITAEVAAALAPYGWTTDRHGYELVPEVQMSKHQVRAFHALPPGVDERRVEV